VDSPRVKETTTTDTVDCCCAQVIGLLASHHLHRVYCISKADRVCGVVTCTDVIRCITSG